MNMVASFLDWILQLASTVKTMNKNVASFTLLSILKIGVLVGGIITLTIMLLSFSAVSHFSLHKLRSTRLSLKNVDQVARWHGMAISSLLKCLIIVYHRGLSEGHSHALFVGDDCCRRYRLLVSDKLSKTVVTNPNWVVKLL